MTFSALTSKMWGSVLSLFITIGSVSMLDNAVIPPIVSETENCVSAPSGPPTGRSDIEHMSLFDSSEAKSRIVMFPSNRNGSSVGAENASTMVGSVSELLLEKDTLPDGSPVTVVQLRSRYWPSSTPFRNSMCCSGYDWSTPGPSYASWFWATLEEDDRMSRADIAIRKRGARP